MVGIEIQVLGPIRVRAGGRPVLLRGHTERLLLAAFVITLNHAVSADQLELVLWGDAPPRSARNTLQSALSRLRTKLRGALAGDGHSYVLELDPDRVDAVRFERLVVAADDALGEAPQRTAELTAAAMALWRGSPFDDLRDEEFVLPEALRLEELRLAATELRLEADVALGRLAQVIPRLRAELAEQPYRERLWYLLMLALARDGRRVEALRCYDEVWDIMAEVGLKPSRPLAELERAIVEERPEVRLELARSLHHHTAHDALDHD